MLWRAMRRFLTLSLGNHAEAPVHGMRSTPAIGDCSMVFAGFARLTASDPMQRPDLGRAQTHYLRPTMTTDACSAAREIVTTMQGRIETDPALTMTFEGAIQVEKENFPDKATYEAAAHIEACPSCQGWLSRWLDTLSPDRTPHRERLAKYCCLHMFEAVTNAAAEVRFSFELFRLDPCWLINEQYAFANFCPWCSRRLPEHAFETDAP